MTAGPASDPAPGTLGPVQILTVAFDGNRFRGEILPLLERLKRHDVVRLIDLLVVRKDSTGAIAVLTATDLTLEEAGDFGAYIGALVGLGANGETGAALGALVGAAESADGHILDAVDQMALADAIPPGSTAAIALIEHRWAIELREAIARADGVEVLNEWLQPGELIQIGLGTSS
jgi:uncharacterized membrane protein